MKTITATVFLLIALLLAGSASAGLVPAKTIWMAQDGNDSIDVSVYTHDNTTGINAYIHFDPDAINITNVNYTGSPWQPLEMPGWSHQGDHVILVLVNFSGVPQGEHKVATLDVECICENCETNLTIDNAEPDGIIVQDMVFKCVTEIAPVGAVISIGDGIGATTLPIMVTNAENAGACDITMKYDPDVVSVKNITAGDMDCTFTNIENDGEGWIRIGAIQGDNPGLTGDYTLANIELEPAGFNGGCDLVLEVTTFKDATPNGTTMNCTIKNGKYISSMNGDVDGNGVVDVSDAAYLAKHIIGTSGYEQIDENAAEVNGDGAIDMADVMYLTKHIIGATGFETLR